MISIKAFNTVKCWCLDKEILFTKSVTKINKSEAPAPKDTRLSRQVEKWFKVKIFELGLMSLIRSLAWF